MLGCPRARRLVFHSPAPGHVADPFTRWDRATQKQEEPAIRVDTGRKYPTSAGQCDKCGYY
ncbi:MAG: hypothetical protein Q6373_024425, partial [Candidatus Sigynarchaeota archaeon]